MRIALDDRSVRIVRDSDKSRLWRAGVNQIHLGGLTLVGVLAGNSQICRSEIIPAPGRAARRVGRPYLNAYVPLFWGAPFLHDKIYQLIGHHNRLYHLLAFRSGDHRVVR